MSNDERLRALYREARPAYPGGAHPDEAAWERLACDEATADERARLAEHVIECAECSDVYRAVMTLRREAPGFDSAAPGVSAVRSRRLPYAIAAGIVLAAVLTPLVWRVWFSAGDSPAIAVQSAAPPPGRLSADPAFRLDKAPVVLSSALVLTPRGAADEREGLLEALGDALVPYRSDDLVEAARRLEPLARRYPDVAEPNLYAGVALLRTGRAPDAVTLLERARSKASPEFADEIDWQLGLAYVHADRPQQAMTPLRRLCAGIGTHRARACDALRVLSSPK